MILQLKKDVSYEEAFAFMQKMTWMGFRVELVENPGYYSLVLLQGIGSEVDLESFSDFAIVEKQVKYQQPYKLLAREVKPDGTVIHVKGTSIGGSELTIMAGPCAIESREQIMNVAEFLSRTGATILRGGAFKPRSSPYSFQGLGEEGLSYLQEAGERYKLPTISEVMDLSQVELLSKYVDILQVGTRNMQNFSLLKKLGEVGNPVMLKRGFAATYQEFLMAAEYIASHGNPNIILCERGIRSYESHSRNTLDLAAVPILQELTHLPVIVDPSHGTGLRRMVLPMARAGVAAGASGIMVEVHPNPDQSVSDASQTIGYPAYEELMDTLRVIAPVVQKRVA
ncbi:MAG: 3-deoxy-7-phosphoheptulonate synthase [Waddliaceae bacterium]|nr:3-deoxy-7-phosphoheptulonate synthase [Waddliaceae bacterium]